MNAQQVIIELNESDVFSTEIWIDLSNRISKLFKLDNREQNRLINSKLGKLVAAIPYLAACEEPKRIALSHLTTLYLAANESGKDVFLHNFSDNQSLLKRLDRISHFEGGNQKIIHRGMDLLAIVMLSDHIKDCIDDKQMKKYNPVESGMWNAQRQIDILDKKINRVPCDEMEKIYSVNEAKAGWWDFP